MKARVFQLLSHVALLAALVGFTAAGYLYFFPDEPGVFVEDPDRELPAHVAGKSQISFQLHNPTRHSVRVLGYQFC